MNDASRRLRPGEILAAAAGVALLALMFLAWYETRGQAESAWEAFSVTDVVLALTALLAIALGVLNVSGRGPAVPVGVAAVTVTLALIALVLLAYRILNQPGPNDSSEVRAGAWLGLAALAALFGGAWWSTSDTRPRPADPPAPEPERRPAPGHS